MGAVEQALAGDTGEQPAQLGDLGNVGLAIEGRLVGIQPQRQPGGGDLQARTLDARRVVALDQRVVVGEEIEGIGVGGAAGNDGRANGAGVVAQVRGAGGGDTGEDTGGHLGIRFNLLDTGLHQVFQLGQLAVKKVAAFCHFQQLMGTRQPGGPGIDVLGCDDFILFGLNYHQLAALRQMLGRLQAMHGRRHHEQPGNGHALVLQAPGQRTGDEAAEGETEQGQRQLGVARAQPVRHGLGIVDFAAAHVMAAGTGTDTAVVEAQGVITHIAHRTLQGGDHLVEHGATLHRVGMADQGDATGVRHFTAEGLERAAGAVDGKRGFADQQRELRDPGRGRHVLVRHIAQQGFAAVYSAGESRYRKTKPLSEEGLVEQSLTPWLLPALALLAGIAIGFLAARLLPNAAPGRTQRQLDDLQQRFDSYQNEVVTHFNTTASLVKKLTQSYQEVQEHLSQGANRLAADELTRQRLLAALNTDESKAPRERLTPPKTNEAPKDYAPKEPDAPGTLDESFGLKR